MRIDDNHSGVLEPCGSVSPCYLQGTTVSASYNRVIGLGREDGQTGMWKSRLPGRLAGQDVSFGRKLTGIGGRQHRTCTEGSAQIVIAATMPIRDSCRPTPSTQQGQRGCLRKGRGEELHTIWTDKLRTTRTVTSADTAIRVYKVSEEAECSPQRLLQFLPPVLPVQAGKSIDGE